MIITRLRELAVCDVILGRGLGLRTVPTQRSATVQQTPGIIYLGGRLSNTDCHARTVIKRLTRILLSHESC